MVDRGVLFGHSILLTGYVRVKRRSLLNSAVIHACEADVKAVLAEAKLDNSTLEVPWRVAVPRWRNANERRLFRRLVRRRRRSGSFAKLKKLPANLVWTARTLIWQVFDGARKSPFTKRYLHQGRPLTAEEFDSLSFTVSGLQTFLDVWETRNNRLRFPPAGAALTGQFQA